MGKSLPHSGPQILHLCTKKIEEAVSKRLLHCDSKNCTSKLAKDDDFRSNLYCWNEWDLEIPRERAEGLESVPGMPRRRMAVIIQASPCGTTPQAGPIWSQKQGGQEAELGIKGRAGPAAACTCF